MVPAGGPLLSGSVTYKMQASPSRPFIFTTAPSFPSGLNVICWQTRIARSKQLPSVPHSVAVLLVMSLTSSPLLSITKSMSLSTTSFRYLKSCFISITSSVFILETLSRSFVFISSTLFFAVMNISDTRLKRFSSEEPVDL